MAVNYAYNYAEIEDATGLCMGVVTTTDPDMDGQTTTVGTHYITIPVYDEEFVFKYYLNGSWYEDAEGTIPWQSELL